MMMMQLTLIDFYAFYFRAVNPKQLLQLSHNDNITGGMFNLIRSYYKALKQFDNVMFVIDKNALRTRSKINKEYKSNRDKSQMQISKQGIDIWKWKDEFFQSVPYISLQYEGLEADDVIADISNQVKNNQLPFHKLNIITLDTDLLQLVDNNKVFYVNLKDEWRLYTPEKLKDKFGIIDYRNILYHKILFGDKSDNISPSIISNLRKQKLLAWLNDKGFDYISSLIFESLKQEIDSLYGKEVVNLDKLKENYQLISLKDKKLNLDMIGLTHISYGNQNFYEHIIDKYNFKAIPSFKDLKKRFDEGNKALLNIINCRETINLDLI